MATEILRPNAAGDEENIFGETGNGNGDHHTLVDEAVSDEEVTTVEQNEASFLRDLYNIGASGVGAGTINHITVYAQCLAEYEPDQTSLKICIKSDSTATEDSEKTITTSWANYSKQWTQNPVGPANWEWADIDALQIGISIRGPHSGHNTQNTYVTQVWVVVDYTAVAAAAELGAFYQKRNPFGINIQTAGQVRAG